MDITIVYEDGTMGHMLIFDNGNNKIKGYNANVVG